MWLWRDNVNSEIPSAEFWPRLSNCLCDMFMASSFNDEIAHANRFFPKSKRGSNTCGIFNRVSDRRCLATGGWLVVRSLHE